MRDDLQTRLDTIDRAALTPLVRRSFDDAGATVTGWRTQPVEGGFGHAYGIYRLQGEARYGPKILTWSLIVKAIGPTIGSQDPTALNYWQREMLVYESGLLDNLPGPLVAPRCLQVDVHPDGEAWLWLEDIVESEPVWPPVRYGLAARHLGQFNGAYLAERRLPSLPWLSTGPLRHRLAMAEPGIVDLPTLAQDPLFADLMPPGGIDRSLGLWAQRDRCLRCLDRLPQTLCHHDAFRRNLLARKDRQGRAETVAIDWSALGTGAVGAEIATLFLGLRFVALDPDQIPDLDTLIFDGYLRGLRQAGWQGDARLARFGYLATATLNNIADKAIKWPRVARHVAALPPGSERPRLLNPGGPQQALAEQRQLLDMGDEALALLDALDQRPA